MTDTKPTIEFLKGGGFDVTHTRFLVYGESGIGKTRFAATFPKVIFLDIDDGLASVDWEIARIPVNSWDELYEAYTYLAEGDHEFESIVIDSLNEAQHLALQNTVDKFPSVRRSYESLPAQGDYGKMLSDFDNMIRALKALPYHIVYIAQVASAERETDIVQPQLVGKASSRNVCRKMDIIGYLYRETDKLAMSFAASEFVTKDRSGRLPSVVHNPTFAKLHNYWIGAATSEEDE